ALDIRYYSVKDTETFSELMLRYRGLLFSICRRYSRDGMEVDDLLQETTLTLWNLREQLFSITLAPKQAAWIWRVARSTCIDLRRKRSNNPTLLPDDYNAPEEDTSLHDTLHELIAQLPEPDRTIVTMHLEGYEYKEIGQKTGMTKNHVGIRLMRIKDKLKEQWNTI
ncbi:MAG: sigma-70 family RNA polymerase sigma factor, partial [Prevotella sp.]|nr:sigma-70 family RNA polymerase sigma factor [Prevotella sp.]